MGVKKEINWDQIELYVKAGCKQINICKAFYIDEVTLRARVKEKYGVEWSAFSAALLSEGEMLIEAKQFDKAMKGYWPALHWLGKIRNGQREADISNETAPNQLQLDQSRRNMELEHENAKLKANADKSQTE